MWFQFWLVCSFEPLCLQFATTRDYSVPVWAIDGVATGWLHPIQVSQCLLREVVKAINPSQEEDGGQQMGLI